MSVSVHSAETLSYLLRTAQHVSLRPSDPLLQDPALFLNTHTRRWTHARKQIAVEMQNVESCAGARMFHMTSLGSESVGKKQRRETLEAQSSELYFKNIQQKIMLLFVSGIPPSYGVKCRTSATMSPFSACTWAMAPRSRITLKTSYTCSKEGHTFVVSDAQMQLFFSVNTNLEFHSFTACPGLYALWRMTATTQLFLWFLTCFISNVLFQECLWSVGCLNECLPR